jgi:DNA-directed RNA polymerase subunit RPC12/RpoP
MAHLDAVPTAGDVKECSECGHRTAVYSRVSDSLFASPAEAAYPGRLPTMYAWTCSRCGHEEREAPIVEHMSNAH